MIVLGIDYGRRKIGLALSEGKLAQPLGVVKVASPFDAVEKIKQAVVKQTADLVVVGVSEGEMAEEQKEFVKLLAQEVDTTVETWDETLTTEDAKSLSLAAGLKRSKRRRLEDAYAASVMLQSYIDHGQKKSS